MRPSDNGWPKQTRAGRKKDKRTAGKKVFPNLIKVKEHLTKKSLVLEAQFIFSIMRT